MYIYAPARERVTRRTSPEDDFNIASSAYLLLRLF